MKTLQNQTAAVGKGLLDWFCLKRSVFFIWSNEQTVNSLVLTAICFNKESFKARVLKWGRVRLVGREIIIIKKKKIRKGREKMAANCMDNCIDIK